MSGADEPEASAVDVAAVAMRISGNPTPEEIAAVVVALDQVAAADAAARRPLRRPPWQHAARVEAVGGRIVRSPADLPTPG